MLKPFVLIGMIAATVSCKTNQAGDGSASLAVSSGNVSTSSTRTIYCLPKKATSRGYIVENATLVQNGSNFSMTDMRLGTGDLTDNGDGTANGDIIFDGPSPLMPTLAEKAHSAAWSNSVPFLLPLDPKAAAAFGKHVFMVQPANFAPGSDDFVARFKTAKVDSLLMNCNETDHTGSAVANAPGAAANPELTCKLETDSTSKGFQPAKWDGSATFSVIREGKGKNRKFYLKTNKPSVRQMILESSDGDEGYTNYTIPKADAKVLGFEYVTIYDGFKRAQLASDGTFATCTK